MQSQDIQDITRIIKEKSHILTELMDEVGKVIVGQRYLIERLVIGMLANGHILLEGVPGLAKTLTVMTLAKALKADYQRVQFTPDLLPADLIGTLIYNPRDGEFSTKKGPIFSNIILADEINRAPAKVQSALLEAMQEKQVTIGENTFKLEEPFLVLATQNPIEQEGTYPLPEAQIDRFMLKLIVNYPTKQEEREILEKKAVTESSNNIKPIISAEDIRELRSVVDQIYIDDKIKDYIVDLVFASREPQKYNLDIDEFIEFGASPRATIYLAVASKAYAFLRGRGYVTPQDVKTIGMDVLRHRIIITYEAEAEELTSEKIIQKIFDNVEVP
ncbi:MAG: MoxR family ATPase [Candidatus Scalindua sp. AMX11]|nr:MAG: MoxR family ATPase [Candidatus Scalindua sp.]NOG82347.1 MoxR family ATPase [Planctomycetota bacterium]RZV66914.1 MAG: MoxR family ATPase [Candidatus Scalindua sp. SCAELEC01]TDE63264.1 MAG: MoxR family ATPase [Candidatus Scalindua sp. AMX11]GJQ60552.1 MAG: ATPase [Candidatus Scalindua sp.]